MMPGGYDIVVQAPEVEPETSLKATARLLFSMWQAAIFENAETGECLPFYRLPFKEWTELLVYRDPAAAKSWRELGADKSNRNQMVHLLVDPTSITLVVDNPRQAEMKKLLHDVRQALGYLPTMRMGEMEMAA